MRRKQDRQTDHLEAVEQRLREERPEAEPLRLDRIKTTAMARAGAGRRSGFAGRRLVAGALTMGLMAAGAGGVLAAGGGESSNGNTLAINAQYSSTSTTTTSTTTSTTSTTSSTTSTAVVSPTNTSHKKGKKHKAKHKAKAHRRHKVVIPRFTG